MTVRVEDSRNKQDELTYEELELGVIYEVTDSTHKPFIGSLVCSLSDLAGDAVFMIKNNSEAPDLTYSRVGLKTKFKKVDADINLEIYG